MFVNVPKRYDFDELSAADIDELIAAKAEKELGRVIQQWPEEKISLENARWGPVIRFGKKIIKLSRKEDNSKYTAEELKDMPLDDVKKMISKEIPGAFESKKKAKAKAVPKTKAIPKSKPARKSGGKK